MIKILNSEIKNNIASFNIIIPDHIISRNIFTIKYDTENEKFLEVNSLLQLEKWVSDVNTIQRKKAYEFIHNKILKEVENLLSNSTN